MACQGKRFEYGVTSSLTTSEAKAIADRGSEGFRSERHDNSILCETVQFYSAERSERLSFWPSGPSYFPNIDVGRGDDEILGRNGNLEVPFAMRKAEGVQRQVNVIYWLVIPCMYIYGASLHALG